MPTPHSYPLTPSPVPLAAAGTLRVQFRPVEGGVWLVECEGRQLGAAQQVQLPEAAAPLWCCWASGEQAGFGVTSQQAGAWLLARRGGWLVALPAGQPAPRRFTSPAQLGWLQQATHTREGDTTEGGLGGLEVADLHRHLASPTQCDPVVELRLGSADLGQQWAASDVAHHLGVQVSTVRSWRSRGLMPPPDGMLGVTAWWWQVTITSWDAGRPHEVGRPTNRPDPGWEPHQ